MVPRWTFGISAPCQGVPKGQMPGSAEQLTVPSTSRESVPVSISATSALMNVISAIVLVNVSYGRCPHALSAEGVGAPTERKMSQAV